MKTAIENKIEYIVDFARKHAICIFRIDEGTEEYFNQTLPRTLLYLTLKENLTYHNLDHVYYMIKNLDPHKDTIHKETNPYGFACLVLAIIYHDSVYKVGDKDNELKSVELAKGELTELLDKTPAANSYLYWNPFIDLIGDLIMKTVPFSELDCSKHQTLSAIIHDLDFLAFSKLLPGYIKTNLSIMQEFRGAGFSLLEVLEGRIQFLYKVLAMESIYFHPVFKHKECMARCNIRLDIFTCKVALQLLRLCKKPKRKQESE
jgi:predicted metal-dependent HD superfamily phosphohydrolase